MKTIASYQRIAIILGFIFSSIATAGEQCEIPFSKIIQPQKISAHHKIVFKSSDLAFFTDSAYQIDSATLELVIRSRHQDVKDLTLALNGINAVHRRGKIILRLKDAEHDRDCKRNRHHRGKHHCKHDRDGRTRHDHDDVNIELSVRLDHLLAEGHTSLVEMISKTLKKHGTITIWINGRAKVVSAQLVVNGSRKSSDCSGGTPTPSPTATPEPTPGVPVVFIDETVPSTTLTNSTTQTIHFSSDQEGVSFYCGLDGNTPSLCTSPIIFSDLANGSHQFQLMATNASGLSSTTTSYLWTVDTVPFDVVLNNVNPSTPVSNSTSMTVAFSASDQSTGESFQCALDGAGYQPCTSPVSFSALTEGTHSFNILGTDAAGNTSINPTHYEWAVDLTAPTAQITLVQGADKITNSTQAEFQFSADESSTFECSMDQGTYLACSSPFSSSDLAEGAHSFSIRAIDAANNTGTEVSYIWNIDVTAAIITLGNVIPTQGLTNGNQLSVEFLSNETTTYTCSFDHQAATPCTSPFIGTATTEGTHQLVIQGTDSAGNLSAPLTASWIMDFTSPQISLGASSPAATSYLVSSSISLAVLSNEPVTFTSQLDGINLNQSSSPIILTGLSEGAHILIISGVDEVGNPANTITYAFTVDTIAPSVQLTGATHSGTTNQTINSISFTSSESGSFECNFDSAGYSACTSPFTASGLAEGSHQLQVRAYDLAGNRSASASFAWTIDFTPPVTQITSTHPSATATRSTDMSVSFVVDDSAAISYCSWDGSMPAPCVSPASMNGLSEGSHSFKVYSIDANGNTEAPGASHAWNVDLTAPVTQITSVAPTGAVINSNQISISFSTNDYAISYCSLDGNAPAPCISPNTIGNLSDGSHTFMVYSVDSIGNIENPGASYSFAVDTTAPVTSIQYTVNGTQATFNLGSSEANSTFSCSLDGLAPTTCASSFTLNDLTAGSHTLIAYATDASGNTDTTGASVTFQVTLPITTILNSVTPSATLTNQRSISFSFSSNQSNVTYLCSLDGATSSPCSSPMSYTSLADGNHSFLVRTVDSSGNVDATGASHSWTVDGIAPTILTATATVTRTSMTITWTTNEPATTALNWGLGTATGNSVPEDFNYTTTHTVTVSGLTPNTIYSYIIRGKDQAGNNYSLVRRSLRTSP